MYYLAFLYFFIAAAAGTPAESDALSKIVEANANAAHATFFQIWAPTFGGVIITLVSGFWTYWRNRGRNRRDQFQIFMDESADYREEIRKERENLKKELAENKIERILLQEQIGIYQSEIKGCHLAVEQYKEQLAIAKIEIEHLTAKIQGLMEKIAKTESE